MAFTLGGYLLDQNKETLVFQEGTGAAGAEMKARRFRLSLDTESIVGVVAKSQKYHIAPDVKTDPSTTTTPCSEKPAPRLPCPSSLVGKWSAFWTRKAVNRRICGRRGGGAANHGKSIGDQHRQRPPSLTDRIPPHRNTSRPQSQHRPHRDPRCG
ncbi:MAG: hypothetical protein M5U34_00860 [Chloroflexi bacterium]|nr:hypothetical protein [Chloroflexota bacterium]